MPAARYPSENGLLVQALAKVTYAALKYEGARDEVLVDIFGGKKMDSVALRGALRRAFGSRFLVSKEEAKAVAKYVGEDGSRFLTQFFPSLEDRCQRRQEWRREAFGASRDKRKLVDKLASRTTTTSIAAGKKVQGLTERELAVFESVMSDERWRKQLANACSYDSRDLSSAVDLLLQMSQQGLSAKSLEETGVLEGAQLRAARDFVDAVGGGSLRATLDQMATLVRQESVQIDRKKTQQNYDPDKLLAKRLRHKSCIEAHGVLDLSMPKDYQDQHPEDHSRSLADLSIVEAPAVTRTLDPFLKTTTPASESCQYASKVAKACANLPFLAQLWLTNNKSLHSLTPSLCKSLRNLRILGVAGVGLRSLPEALGQFVASLRHLYAQRNMLDVLPPTLAHLVNLETIDISQNAFFEIPAHLPPRIQTLRLADNAIPGEVLQHQLSEYLPRSVRLFDVRGNDIDTRQKEAMRQRSHRDKMRVLIEAEDGDLDAERGEEMRAILKVRAAKTKAEKEALIGLK